MLSTVARQIAAELAILMAHDVDVVHLMSVIRAGLPPQLTITNESILLAPAPVSGPATPAVDGTEPADTPAAPRRPPLRGPAGHRLRQPRRHRAA